MGDVGSLARRCHWDSRGPDQEQIPASLSAVFVVEALSVIIQTTSYKLTGRRVFRMARYHHFEKLGWQEPKIVVRFWIVSIMLALVALASLKVR